MNDITQLIGIILLSNCILIAALYLAISVLNDRVWKNRLKNDPNIGGELFEANGHLAYYAAKEYFGDEFIQQIKILKLNHHPGLFRGLAKIGHSMMNDTPVYRNRKTPKQIAKLFYKGATQKETK